MRGSHSRIAVLRSVGAVVAGLAAVAGCVTMLLTAACGQPCLSTPDTSERGSAGGAAAYVRPDGGASRGEAGVVR
jgi:hypothetical protein